MDTLEPTYLALLDDLIRIDAHNHIDHVTAGKFPRVGMNSRGNYPISRQRPEILFVGRDLLSLSDPFFIEFDSVRLEERSRLIER